MICVHGHVPAQIQNPPATTKCCLSRCHQEGPMLPSPQKFKLRIHTWCQDIMWIIYLRSILALPHSLEGPRIDHCIEVHGWMTWTKYDVVPGRRSNNTGQMADLWLWAMFLIRPTHRITVHQSSSQPNQMSATRATPSAVKDSKRPGLVTWEGQIDTIRSHQATKKSSAGEGSRRNDAKTWADLEIGCDPTFSRNKTS